MCNNAESVIVMAMYARHACEVDCWWCLTKKALILPDGEVLLALVLVFMCAVMLKITGSIT